VRILNPVTLVFFQLTRIAMFLTFGISRSVVTILRVLWIPVKAALYVAGGAVGLGLVVGVIILIANGGHLHKQTPPWHPGTMIFGK
jgi:hypothetical protein